jgi:peptidoglycan/xylan/chitin deacetylase (PgdA/CDA1 family)
VKRARVATVAGIGAVAAVTAPALTAVGPVRRRLTPRLAGAASSHHIALTFDDGPDPSSTPHFLDLLAQHNRRATFFVLAAQAIAVPWLVRRMVDEGHEVAIHGWSHRSTLAIRPTHLARQLEDAKHAVEAITGSAASWYRPPYGVLSLEAMRVCRSLELTPVLWTAWGRDWERWATPPRIVSTVLRTLEPGGTILLHDTDLHARGDWRMAFNATDDLLSGPLRSAAVGPLHDHWR